MLASTLGGEGMEGYIPLKGTTNTVAAQRHNVLWTQYTINNLDESHCKRITITIAIEFSFPPLAPYKVPTMKIVDIIVGDSA